MARLSSSSCVEMQRVSIILRRAFFQGAAHPTTPTDNVILIGAERANAADLHASAAPEIMSQAQFLAEVCDDSVTAGKLKEKRILHNLMLERVWGRPPIVALGSVPGISDASAAVDLEFNRSTICFFNGAMRKGVEWSFLFVSLRVVAVAMSCVGG
jgi:hypothetical protein